MKKRNSATSVLTLTFAACLVAACGQKTQDIPQEPQADPDTAAASAPTPVASPTSGYPTRVFWGDTHVHTGWSADAGMDGAITSPDDAYRFALGETITSNAGIEATLARPFDWFLVSDHSDGMGTINEIVSGNEELMQDETLARWSEALNSGDEERAAAAKSELIIMQSEERLPAAVMDPKWMASAWEKTIEAAERYYSPGEFTTFIAYEWTVNSGGGDNLHRNVIYRDGAERASTRLPLTTFETQDPEDLWAWMAAYETETGGRLLAIPHNGNMSNGRMFEEQRFDGSPMTAQWAEQRNRFERLYEVTQIKGQSESHPVLSPNDEFAAWDLWDRGNLILNPKPNGDADYQYEYWREALKSGLRLEDELGTNPFQYGANAATDTHTGLSTPDEDNFFGKFKTLEPNNSERWDFPLIDGPTGSYMGWEQAASGIMAVWATENTREALWDAMYRRETYATTGPRITLRFFAGFDFVETDLDGDIAETGYSRGIPMGGDLTAAPEGRAASFLVVALKDPDGANLDRVQVVKGWVDADGEAHEKIFDIAWSGERQPGEDGKLPAVGNTVDMDTATYTNSIGAAELRAVFSDPEFDPGQKAVYYVRALEIPTPRWTLYDKVHLGAEPGDDVPLVHQERAFSSPIWYTP